MVSTGLAGGPRRRAATAPSSATFVVGAAVGSGLAAVAALRGGADFLMVLNAGRLRVKGAPSIASILPVADGNISVLELGKTEIIPQCGRPVFFGANVYAPQRKLSGLITEAKAQGFAGLVNFPTAIHLPEDLQREFEEYGIGFGAELALLAKAKSKGLDTVAYVRTKQHALAAAEAGIDTICLNFGWNIGGASGARTDLTIDDVRHLADDIYQAIARRYTGVRFLLEGGPIETAEDLAEIYRSVPVHGYIGGSTLDRLPTESSISDRTRSFKGIELLAGELQDREEKADRRTRTIGLIGSSKPIRHAFDRLMALAGYSGPVLIYGEAGSGRGFAAEALHRMSPRETLPYTELLLAQLTGHEAGARLFGLDGRTPSEGRPKVPGLLESLSGGSLYIEDISLLPKRLQTRLARYLERGIFSPLDGRRVVSSRVRVICSSVHPLAALSKTGTMSPDLCREFMGNEVAMPALRERKEDIPGLLRAFIGQASWNQTGEIVLDASVVGALSSHTWPGNITELRRLATRLDELAGQAISAADILSALEAAKPKPVAYLDERDWIAAALKRNRFRRADTARELGLSRKTLYNKIKRYDLT